MSTRRRRLIGLFLGLFLMSSAAGFVAQRIYHWHTIGWIGAQVTPLSEVRVGAQQSPSIVVKPGELLVLYQKAPAARAGMRTRDKVETINGIPLKDQDALSRLDRQLRAGDPIVYRYQRNGRVAEARVVLESPFGDGMLLAQIIVPAAVGVCFFVIGLLVFVLRPDDRRATVFYALALAGGFGMIAAGTMALDASSLRGMSEASTSSYVALALFSLISTLFLPLSLHLALIFPRERPAVVKHPRLLRWIYALPVMAAVHAAALAFTLLATAPKPQLPPWARTAAHVYLAAIVVVGIVLLVRLVSLWRRNGLGAVIARPVQSLTLLHALLAGTGWLATLSPVKLLGGIGAVVTISFPILIVLGFPFLSIVALYRSYRDAGVEEKRQVKWPLWGTIIALGLRIVGSIAGPVLGVLLMAFEKDIWLWMPRLQMLDLIPRAFYILIPISFAAAILKYRLMNIDIIIRKTVLYAFLSGAILVVYLVLVGGLGTLVVTLTGVRNETMIIAATLVVAAVFVPLRNRLQLVVDRNLFRQRTDYPQALRVLATETMTANDPQRFMVSAAEKLQQALQNRALVIFVRRNNAYLAAAKVGAPDAILGRLRVPPAIDAVLDRAFDPRRRTLADDVAAPLKQLEAALVVPLRGHGFLALSEKLSDRAFDVEDLEFLASAADQIALGLDRIRMTAEEHDFAQASELQQTLLPRDMPRVAGLDASGTWRPARSVGGDYYDFIQLGERQLAVCIGDVAGKGMPAALLMSSLQAAVRASAAMTRSPRELCEHVRRVVVSNLTGGRFVTFFFAIVDTDAMRVRWCNAGHNAPALVRVDGSVERLATGGPVLSRLFRDLQFEEGEVELRAGDRLVLFTDGASEARDASGEMFGETALEELLVEHRTLSARALQEIIVDRVLGFSGGVLEDDLTLVVVAA
ncbi:MAG TPA: SpoIIE family protein phosphatase [Thermoanaerobaculia bacterium]